MFRVFTNGVEENVIPNPMRPKNDGCYHLMFDEDDGIQTHLSLYPYQEPSVLNLGKLYKHESSFNPFSVEFELYLVFRSLY